MSHALKGRGAGTASDLSKGESAAVHGNASDSSKEGSFFVFFRTLRNFNGDIWSLPAPTSIVGPISLTEFSSYWAERPDLLVAPANEPDPQKRSLLVLKWYLSTLKPSYASRNENGGNEKKPLNPFLGELFLGRWEDDPDIGTTQLISEQVSHHPPVTAYCIWNEKHGVRLQGYNGQDVNFFKMVPLVQQIGHALLHLDKYDEDYLITLPSLRIENIVARTPFVELDKTNYISSSSGYVSKMDYSGKGWLSGKRNTFTASMYPAGKESEVLYTIDGQWTESFTIKEGTGSSSHNLKPGSASKTLETYDARTSKTVPLKTAKKAQLDDIEAPKAWFKVKNAIRNNDLGKTAVAKSHIENMQRDLRTKEEEEHREWQRRFFSKVPNHPLFDKLAAPIKARIEADRTGGIWRFDAEKAKDAKPPFHPGLDLKFMKDEDVEEWQAEIKKEEAEDEANERRRSGKHS